MHHLRPGQGEEERQHRSEMQRKKTGHGAAAPGPVERETSQAGEAQEDHEGAFSATRRRRPQCRVGSALQQQERHAAEHKENAAGEAQELGQRPERVGRRLVERVVQHRPRDGRGEAQEKAVGRGVVRPAPCVAVAVAKLEVAALALAAGEVAQPRRIAQGVQRLPPSDAPAPDSPPVPADRHRQNGQRQEEGWRKDRHHRAMGQHRIEALTTRGAERRHGPEQQRDPDGRGKRQRHAAPLDQVGQGGEGGEILPTRHPQVGQHPRQVQVELVRRGVLAGVIAAAAVVAEVCELREISVGEGALSVDRREHRAEALAVAACVADLDLAADLRGEVRRAHVKRHGRRPPVPRSGRTRCRSSSRILRDSPVQGSSPP